MIIGEYSVTDILIILQARLSSSRLPGKVLKKILGKPMLEHQLARLSHIKIPHHLLVATSSQSDDDPIAVLCAQLNVNCFRGELSDVLSRYYHAAQSINQVEKIKHIVRLTGDCPLVDAEIIDKVISHYLTKKVDYCSNCAPATLPDGLDVEVFSFASLKVTFEQAVKPSEREHVTPYIRNNPQLFTLANYSHHVDLSHLRWTVDEPEDFELVCKIYQHLYPDNPTFDLVDILTLIAKYPALTQINQHIMRNEGLLKSQQADQAIAKLSLLNELARDKNHE